MTEHEPFSKAEQDASRNIAVHIRTKAHGWLVSESSQIMARDILLWAATVRALEEANTNLLRLSETAAAQRNEAMAECKRLRDLGEWLGCALSEPQYDQESRCYYVLSDGDCDEFFAGLRREEKVDALLDCRNERLQEALHRIAHAHDEHAQLLKGLVGGSWKTGSRVLGWAQDIAKAALEEEKADEPGS